MDDIITLITEGQEGIKDENGNVSYLKGYRTVMCKVRSVSSREYYSAGTQDLKPELVFVISHYADYEGEKEIDYDGVRYVVMRTYRSGDAIEITVTRKIGAQGDDIK